MGKLIFLTPILTYFLQHPCSFGAPHPRSPVSSATARTFLLTSAG